MPEKLSSSHFFRIMRLPEGQRRDLLEFLGQTALPQAEIEQLITRAERQESKELHKTA